MKGLLNFNPKFLNELEFLGHKKPEFSTFNDFLFFRDFLGSGQGRFNFKNTRFFSSPDLKSKFWLYAGRQLHRRMKSAMGRNRAAFKRHSKAYLREIPKFRWLKSKGFMSKKEEDRIKKRRKNRFLHKVWFGTKVNPGVKNTLFFRRKSY